MKNIFIVNPVAGKKAKVLALISEISSYFTTHSEKQFEIFTPESKERCTEMARQIAEKGEEVNLFACGGDGTMFDVVNGIVGFDNVNLGVIPCGTGNDFIKYFGQNAPKQFSNISAQINGRVKKIDAIKACGHYSLNSCSVGMDANVCAKKGKFSKIPGINGQTAYVMALLNCFLYSIKNRLKVQIDNNEPMVGDFLFVVGGNGRYYGGGFKSTPDAVMDDGLIDCLTIDAVGRAKVLSLLKKYNDGKHIDLPICKIKRAEKVHITANEKTPVNMDGEVFYEKDITFEIVPKLINLIVPDGV